MREMGRRLMNTRWWIPALLLLLAAPVCADVVNGGFESGDFTGWTADPTWVLNQDSHIWYSGWHGKYYAWSGGNGEPALGKLTSKPFVLDKSGVQLMVAGWSSVFGTGKPRRWNYVTLNLEDGTEIDRVYTPDATTFAPMLLDGSKYKGKSVYIQAVDDADQPSFSMICIDDVRTVDIPDYMTKPLPPIPGRYLRNTVKLEDENCIVEISRANGSLARIYDKKGAIELVREPRLAGSFKYSLPIPGKEPWQALEANYVIGSDQRPPSIEQSGRKIMLRWESPLKSTIGGSVDSPTTMTIELTDGGVLLSMEVANASPYGIGEVYFPMLGGIQGFGRTAGQLKLTEFVKPSEGGSASGSKIFYVFNNMAWLGDQGAEQFYSYPKDMPEPWVELYSAKLQRSAYLGARDPSDRPKIARLELIPSNSATPRADGNWPRPEELHGQPVGVTFSFVDLANTPAGTHYVAAPVFVRFHEGDAQQRPR